MMSARAWRRMTLAVMALAAGILALWDVMAALNGVEGDTISEVVRDAVLGGEAPPWILTLLIGFGSGVLAGHLLWPQRPPAGGRERNF